MKQAQTRGVNGSAKDKEMVFTLLLEVERYWL